MEKKTYAKMIQELVKGIEKKEGTEHVLDDLHSLVEISKDYLEAKEKGDSELQRGIENALRETFEYLLINLAN